MWGEKSQQQVQQKRTVVSCVLVRLFSYFIDRKLYAILCFILCSVITSFVKEIELLFRLQTPEASNYSVVHCTLSLTQILSEKQR